MAPKAVDLDAIPADALLPLQDWLKLLAGRGVEMRVAMTLAAKMWVKSIAELTLATIVTTRKRG